MSYGMFPAENTEKTINDIDPKSFTLFVRNGSGVDGAAAMIATNLTNAGYNVKGTDNAETNVYTETLIIYKNKDYKGDAEAVKNSINNGRTVNGDGLYNMETDVLIIIGDDYKI